MIASFIKKKLDLGDFVQSSGSVIIWVLLSQVIMFLSTPIISRIYKPSQFGIYATFTSLMYIVNQVITLRSELLISTPKEEQQALSNATNCFAVVLAFCTLIAIFLFLFSTKFFSLIQLPYLPIFLWGIPLCLLAIGVRNTLIYWLMRKNKFTTVGITNFLQAPAVLATQVYLGLYWHADSQSLILGAYVSWIIPSLFIAYVSTDKTFIKGLSKEIKNIKRGMKSNFAFILNASLSVLLLSLTNYMPTILIASLYSPKITAWFALCIQAIFSPLDILSISISQVYISKGSQLLNNNVSLSSFYIKSTILLFCIALLPSCIILLYAPSIFAKVFGRNWIEAGKYAQILMPMLLVRFVTMSTSHNLVILKKQGLALLWSFIIVTLLFLAFTPAMLLHNKPSILWTLEVLSINLSIAYVLYIIINLVALRKSVTHIPETQQLLI